MPLALATERAPLLAALGTILKAVERTTIIPILGHVLMEARGDTLTITGTDTDIQVTASLPARIEAEGQATIAAQAFRDLVRRAPEKAELRIALNDQTGLTQISAGRARASMPGLNVADFPVLALAAQAAFTHTFALEGDRLARLLKQCEFAISTEETRYYLGGIYCHVVRGSEGPSLRFVATDGHRLARAGILAPAGADESLAPIIIPRKTVALIRDLADGAGAEAVTIEISAKALRTSAGALAITSKLIDGTYPDYERVIPGASDRTARVPTKALGRILDFCATLNLDKRPAVKLEFTDGSLSAHLRNSEGGEVGDEIEIEFEGEPFTMGIDAKYLAEILDHASADTVRMRLGPDPSVPMTVGDRSEESLFVLCPLRIP